MSARKKIVNNKATAKRNEHNQPAIPPSDHKGG